MARVLGPSTLLFPEFGLLKPRRLAALVYFLSSALYFLIHVFAHLPSNSSRKLDAYLFFAQEIKMSCATTETTKALLNRGG